MASAKGKSFKIHQTLNHLEEALAEWDHLEENEADLKEQANLTDSRPKSRQEKTRRLLRELKEQLDEFVGDMSS